MTCRCNRSSSKEFGERPNRCSKTRTMLAVLAVIARRREENRYTDCDPNRRLGRATVAGLPLQQLRRPFVLGSVDVVGLVLAGPGGPGEGCGGEPQGCSDVLGPRQ